MLLDRIQEVYRNPFPHVVIRRALPPDYYRELMARRPIMEEVLNGRDAGPNVRVDMSTRDCLEKLPQIWREFCAFHSSQTFFAQVIEVFLPHIEKLYPSHRWEEMTLGVRAGDGTSGMECQVGINTPSPTLTSVCEPHIDNERELYAGLLYMKDDEEDGGDLDLYKWKSGRKFAHKRMADKEAISLVKTVPYEANTFVMFLNTPESVHGVSPRKSPKTRNLVNVIADMDQPLFTL